MIRRNLRRSIIRANIIARSACLGHDSAHPSTSWMSESQRCGNMDRSKAYDLGNFFTAGFSIDQEQVADFKAGVSSEVKTGSTMRSR